MTNQQIADFLNQRAGSRVAYAVSRNRISDGYNLQDNPDMFPGEVLLATGGDRWTAQMVADEFAAPVAR